MPNGSYKFFPRTSLEQPYKVVVVDEVSMLPTALWTALLKHPVYIIATGDPFQLPAINPDDDNHILDKPHIFLDEIMRQAQDSEIIRLSMWIREGKPLAEFPCKGEQVQVIDKSQLVAGMYEWADQIICATNNKRIEVNNFVRQQRGYKEEPQIGDKITSLRNHWDYSSSSGDWALTNGTIGTIDNFDVQNIRFPEWIYDKRNILYMFTSIVLEDGDKFNCLPVDYKRLKDGQSTLTPKQIYAINKSKNLMEAPFEFDYAYGITCHRAQGSEWNKVLVFEEWFPNSAEEHARWLYTAITRASEKLVIVKK